MTQSDIAIQAHILAARNAGALDAPIRATLANDEAATSVTMYLANGKVINWPPTPQPKPPAAQAAPEESPPPSKRGRPKKAE